MKKIIRTIITIILIGVMVYALYQIYGELDKYATGRAIYHKIAELKTPESDKANNKTKAKNKTKSDKNAKSNTRQLSKVNFDRLKSINSDVVAWLELKGTPIDYPVVQGRNNKEYLKKAFDGRKSAFGTLFVDNTVDRPFRDFNTIIYGHHMKDRSMFQFIDRFKEKHIFNDYRTFDLYTPTKDYKIEVLAYLNIKANSKLYKTFFYDNLDKEEHLALIKKRAKQYRNINIGVNDRLVMMSTCTFNFKNARSVVIGVLREK